MKNLHLFVCACTVVGLALIGSARAQDWTSADIGGPAPPGSSTDVSAGADGSAWDVEGGGSDIWGNADHFRYTYLETPISGDFSARCLVQSFEAPHSWGKAGIMARNDLDADSINAFAAITGTQRRLTHQWRDSKGGGSGSSHSTWYIPPIWIQLERSGTLIRSYYSLDGLVWRSWREHDQPSLAGDVYIGLAVTSHQDGSAATAEFREVDMFAPAFLPSPIDFACEVDGDDVNLAWNNNGETYDHFVLIREGMWSGTVTLQEDLAGTAEAYADTGTPAASEPLTYVLVGVGAGGGVSLAIQCTTAYGGGVIDGNGFLRSWLFVGPLAKPGGCNPGADNIRKDYLSGFDALGDPVTEGDIIPEEGDEIEINFDEAQSTSVINPGSSWNPDAPLIATVFRWDDGDDTIDHNNVFGSDENEMMAYSFAYLTNSSGSSILANCAIASDDAIQVLLDNDEVMLVGACRGYGGGGSIQNRALVVIDPGEHRLVVKVFDGGGGSGFRLRFEAPDGTPLGPPHGLTLDVVPTLTEVPAPKPVPTVEVTRDAPIYVLDGETGDITLSVSGIAGESVDITEIIPAGVNVTDPGTGTLAGDGRSVAWSGVANGDLTYTVEVEPGIIRSLAGVYSVDGAGYPTGGDGQIGYGVRVSEDVVGVDIGTPGNPGLQGGQEITDPGPPIAATVTGGGSDIWDRADHFHYAFGPFDGNFILEAQVDAFPRVTNDWGKAGVMARTSADANSAYAYMSVRAGGGGGPGYDFQFRSAAGAGADHLGLIEPIAFPYSVRITVVDGHVTGYVSEDGVTWTPAGEATIPTAEDGSLLGGLAVTSHDNGQVATATFSNVAWADLPNCTLADLAAQWSGADVQLTWSNGGSTFAKIAVERLRFGETDSELLAELDGAAEAYTDAGAPDDIALTYSVTAYGEYAGEEIPICTISAGLLKGGYLVFQDGLFPDPSYTGTQDAHIIRYRSDQYDDADPHLYNMGAHDFIEEGDWNGGHGDHKEILVQFDTSAIPTGSTVEAAELRLFYDYSRDNAYLDHQAYAHKVLKAWNEGRGGGVDGSEALAGEVTWRYANTPDPPLDPLGAGGVTWDVDTAIWDGCDYPDDQRGGAYGPDDIDVSEGIISNEVYGSQATQATWVTWDVTAYVQAWVDDPSSNHGVKVTQNPGNDPCNDYIDGGYDFRSSNHGTVVTRPLLVVKGVFVPPGPFFIRSDTEPNGVSNIADGIQILERLFTGREAFGSNCDETGDANGDGQMDIGDAIWVFNYLFGGGPPPPPPFPECGTADIVIGCEESSCVP